jgi:hypothetical protein
MTTDLDIPSSTETSFDESVKGPSGRGENASEDEATPHSDEKDDTSTIK